MTRKNVTENGHRKCVISTKGCYKLEKIKETENISVEGFFFTGSACMSNWTNNTDMHFLKNICDSSTIRTN